MILRLRYIVLFCLSIVLVMQSGCHQRLQTEPVRRPDWTPTTTGAPDPELNRFLAANPSLTVQIGNCELRPLTTPLMRWLVLQNDPGVIAARAELTASLATEGSAGNWPDPEIDGRYMTDGDGGNEFEAALVFGIPWSGRTSASGKAAKHATKLARIEFDQAALAALRELDGSLGELAWATERLAVQRDLATRSEHFAILARTRQQANVADPLDVALILADAAGDQRAVLHSRQELETIVRDLGLRFGIAPGNWQPEPLTLVPPQINFELVTIETAASCRSQWLAAQAKYEMTEWEAAAAARERIPDLSVGPVIASGDSESSYGVTAGMALPLFSGAGGRYQAALARRDAAYGLLRQEARSAVIEIETRTSHLKTTIAELTLLGREPLSAAEEAMALAGERYGAGQVDILLLLTAHRAYSDLKLEILGLRLESWLALLALEEAVGCSLRNDELR